MTSAVIQNTFFFSVRSLLAVSVTIALFLIMMALVGRPPALIDEPTPTISDPIHVNKIIDVFPTEPTVEEIPPPQTQPTTVLPRQTNELTLENDPFVLGQVIKPISDKISGVPLSGGPIATVKVQAVYPPRAIARGYEGYCTVQYSITATGATSNIHVVDGQCTHRLFEKASINAAKKFKYRPKMENGQGVAVHGMQNRFTFNLE